MISYLNLCVWSIGLLLILGCVQSLVANEDFQHILRVQNTNVDGKQKIMFAMTSIKGIGRRFANIACKKADIDMSKRLLLFPPCFLPTSYEIVLGSHGYFGSAMFILCSCTVCCKLSVILGYNECFLVKI